MRKTVLAVSALLIVAGCQTPQQPAPPPPTPSSPPVPHRDQQPVMPPVRSAGPLERANVGTYMDAQEADLRVYLRGQGVQVARRGDVIAVTLQSDRLFDNSEISDWGDAFLRAMVQVLGHYDRTVIEVNGYGDAAAKPEAAIAVTQKRAKLVADGLARYGVAAGRLTINGFGATNLRVANPSDPKNRRIEIKITPNPK